jgi:hypothetical protein
MVNQVFFDLILLAVELSPEKVVKVNNDLLRDLGDHAAAA